MAPSASQQPAAAGTVEAPTPPTARYFAWLYSPEDQRPLVAALCGIEREVAESLRAGLEHSVAHVRLEWWREECERFARGTPVHPLSRQLQAAARGAGKAVRLDPRGFVDVTTWDLARATFGSRKEVQQYCERWARAMTQGIVEHALADAPDAGQTGRAIGAAIREIELLADIAREAHAGRLRLPLDELERIGIAPEALVRPPWPEALAAHLAQRHRELRAALGAAIAALDARQQSALRGLLVWAALAARLSRRAERALPQALEAPHDGGFASAWIAWRAARAAQAGRLTLT